MPPPSPGEPAQLFYSYSHKDEKLRDQLEAHLSTLTREKRISAWHDRRITAGTEWKGEIDEHLKSSSVILLLVTANFLASDYCNDVELRYAMEQHEKGNARVIPVILRPCDWKTTIFAKLQALPTDGKPVIDWKTRDAAFLNVVEGIRKALDGMGHTSLASETTSAASAISVPVLNALHQLPAPPADFTGRANELKELLAAVKAGGVTISGLQGLGGVGKTALALKLAEQLKRDYPDAQFYLDLKGVSPQPLTPRDAMAYIIRAWHPTAQLPEKEDEVAALYRSVLEGKRALLLMDNARDAQQVEPLIPPTSCLFLVTSRQHFKLPGSITRDIGKLPHPDACKLLIKIAPRLGKERQEEIDRLAVLCGHLALALEKVGSALHIKENFSASDYAQRLTDVQERLKLTQTDAALQSSYDLLSDELRQKFRFLSVFADTFDLAAAAAIWDILPGVAQDSLGELFAHSLVDFDKTTKRYSLHDLVRLFAGSLLNAEERYSAQKHHAAHYLEVMQAADALYKQGGEAVIQGLALFDMEWTNIEAGYVWVAAHQQEPAVAEWCFWYPHAAASCLALRQPPRERIRWLEPARVVAKRFKRRSWEASALGNLGSAYFNLGQYPRAREYFQEQFQISREIGDRIGETRALNGLGITSARLGEYRRAIDYYQRQLRIAREMGDRSGEVGALGNLGTAHHILEEFRHAIEYYEQALQVTCMSGDRWAEASVLGGLGIAYHSLGEYRRAIDYYERELRIARAIGDRLGEVNALFSSALALYPLGDRAAAIARAEAALKISETIESPAASTVRAKLSEWRGEDKSRDLASAE